MSLPTLLDHQRSVASASLDVSRTRTALESAQTAFATASDQSRYATEGERDAQVARVLPTLTAAETAAVNAADAAQAVISDVQDVTTDPTPALTVAQESSMSAREPSVMRDVAGMTTGDLVRAIKRAAVAGDDVALYLLWKHGRGKSSSAQTTTTATGGDVPFTVPDDQAARSELRGLLNDIAEKFTPKDLTDLGAKAAALRSEVIDLRRLATKRQMSGRT